MERQNERVVVAMSGGVDSSVAAYLLHKQGYDVVGLSMRLWTYEREATHGCCTPEDLYDARRVADEIGIPHYVSDFEPVFEETVVRNFVESYAKGETPNPCVRCNQDVKFKALLKRAEELGAKFLATGHYARVKFENGKWELLRSNDVRRDQSYFLFGLSQTELSKLMFPLGELTKDRVREIGREMGLRVADKPDSQEICFVPKDYTQFVEKKLGQEQIQPGNIVDPKGNVLGKHSGIHQFTIGQRKGIGISSQLPTYVLSVQSNGNVVVGDNDELYRTTFLVRDLRWIDESPAKGVKLKTQIRSRFTPEAAVLEPMDGNRMQVSFEKPQRAITPGQAAVFYDGDRLVGGGWIESVV